MGGPSEVLGVIFVLVRGICVPDSFSSMFDRFAIDCSMIYMTLVDFLKPWEQLVGRRLDLQTCAFREGEKLVTKLLCFNSDPNVGDWYFVVS